MVGPVQSLESEFWFWGIPSWLHDMLSDIPTYLLLPQIKMHDQMIIRLGQTPLSFVSNRSVERFKMAKIKYNKSI